MTSSLWLQSKCGQPGVLQTTQEIVVQRMTSLSPSCRRISPKVYFSCKKWVSFCSPGCCSPVNFLEEDGNRVPAVAVFGILFSSLSVLVLDSDPLPFVANSAAENRGIAKGLSYWKIMALLYYPAFYYPLIACAKLRHRAGYFLGCLLAWSHCLVLLWQKVECPQSAKIYRYYSLLSYLPIILCLVILSLWYPAQLVKRGVTLSLLSNQPCNLPGSAFPLLFLSSSTSKGKPSVLSRLQAYLRSYIYTPQEGFQIPLKLLLSQAVAVIAVYQVALLLLVAFVPHIQIIRSGMTKELTALFVQFGIVPAENPAGIPGDKELETLKHYIWSLEVCFVSSLVASCLLTFCMLMKSMVKHRINLQRLYRGAVAEVFHRPRKLRPSQQALVCWMCFVGFQAAFACLGNYKIRPLGARGAGRSEGRAKKPFWLTLVAAVIAQNLLTHYCFLERGHPPKGLTNRRALYLVTYLLFPINVLVGVLAGVWRMVLSALYNIVHFCQLDESLLGHGVEAFDPGYRTYCHCLKIEVSQAHPMMKAFCALLLQLHHPPGLAGLRPRNLEEGVKLVQAKKLASKTSRRKQTRARWCLAYSLLKNPSLLPYRKGALSDSKANGMQAGHEEP
uniref:Receptor for retinol uptake STRA6 n=1 Tax=Varanus komodoensis TaxID=61221 RepID=A0A8D2IN61_VARKO